MAKDIQVDGKTISIKMDISIDSRLESQKFKFFFLSMMNQLYKILNFRSKQEKIERPDRDSGGSTPGSNKLDPENFMPIPELDKERIERPDRDSGSSTQMPSPGSNKPDSENFMPIPEPDQEKIEQADRGSGGPTTGSKKPDPENFISIKESDKEKIERADRDPGVTIQMPTSGFNKLDAIVTSENSTKFILKKFERKNSFKQKILNYLVYNIYSVDIN